MKLKVSFRDKVYTGVNTAIISIMALGCLLPLIHIVSLSFSDDSLLAGKAFLFWPAGFSLQSYKRIVDDPQYFVSFGISLVRVALGLALNITLTVLSAFPLSHDSRKFPGRTFFTWFFMGAMLFSGGLIPTFMVIKETGLMNSIWALVIPGAVPIFSVLVLQNFFKMIPRSLEEAAMMDGASYFKVLFKVYLPISKPGIATTALLGGIGHWNSWFDAKIYLRKASSYPLQAYLQSVSFKAADLEKILDPDQLEAMMSMGTRTLNAAQLVIAMVPVLAIYPFVQRYFIKGLVIGSVKE